MIQSFNLIKKTKMKTILNLKKNYFKVALMAVFAAVAGYGVYANQQSEAMSDLMLANVEALARYEGNPECPNGCISSPYSYCICYKIYTNMREAKW